MVQPTVSFETIKQLIFIAKKSGADCVKFKRDVETLLTKKEKERKYNSVNAMAPHMVNIEKLWNLVKNNLKNYKNILLN